MIKLPSYLFYLVYLKFSKLDPMTVSNFQSKIYFRMAAPGNNLIIENTYKYVIAANTVFDIGSNAGYFAKGLCERGYTGKLCLFEPVPNLLSISVNTLKDFKVEKIFINSALGDTDGEMELFLAQNSNIGWNTFVHQKTNSGKSIKITIEDTYKYIKLFSPEFLKIDVEGYEFFILTRIIDLISTSYKPTFVVELGWGISNPHWSDFLILASKFQEIGYHFYSLTEPDKVLSLFDLKHLDRTMDVILTANNVSH